MLTITELKFCWIVGIIDYYDSVTSKLVKFEFSDCGDHDSIFGFDGIFSRWRWDYFSGLVISPFSKLNKEQLQKIYDHLKIKYGIDVDV